MHRLLVALGLWLGTLPALADAVPRAAVMPLKAKRVTREIVRILDDLLVNALGATGRLRVIGSEEIEAVLAAENIKDQLGCDSISCAAEIGGALNARYVVSGSVGRLGDSVVINLTLFDTEQMAVAARGTQTVADDENQYAEGMRGAVASLLGLGIAAGSEQGTAGAQPEAALPPPVAAPATLGRLIIRSQPEGADVMLDGKDVGHTPLVLDAVPSGRVTLTVSIDHHATEELTATVRAGAEGIVDLVLKPWPRLTLAGPADAMVEVDGHPAGKLPYQGQLPPGQHEVRVMAPHHFDWEHRFELLAGTDVAFDVEPTHVDAIADARRNRILLASGATVLGAGFLGFTVYSVVTYSEYERVANEAGMRRWQTFSYLGLSLSALAFIGAYYGFTTLPAESHAAVAMVPVAGGAAALLTVRW